MPTEPIVYIVDDDSSVREALESLVRSVGLRAELFRTAQEFLKYKRADAPSCLVLDVRLPGLSGLDLQRELGAAEIPIIFITGHGDIAMSVHAMKAGAVEFLTKPFRDQDLLDAIHQAIERDRGLREKRAEADEARGRYESLTHREREVLQLDSVSGDRRKARCQLGPGYDLVVMRLAFSQSEDLFNDKIDIQRLLDWFTFLHERANPCQHAAGPVSVSNNAANGCTRFIQVRRLGGKPAQASVSIGDHPGERLVQLMSDRGRQLSGCHYANRSSEFQLRLEKHPFRSLAIGDLCLQLLVDLPQLSSPLLHSQLKILSRPSQCFFCLFALRDITHYSDHAAALLRLDRTQHDVHGKFCAVLSPPVQLESDTHRPHSWLKHVVRPMLCVLHLETGRYEHLDPLANQFLARITEHRFRLIVGTLDATVGIDSHDGVGCRLKQGSQRFVEFLQFRPGCAEFLVRLFHPLQAARKLSTSIGNSALYPPSRTAAAGRPLAAS